MAKPLDTPKSGIAGMIQVDEFAFHKAVDAAPAGAERVEWRHRGSIFYTRCELRVDGIAVAIHDEDGKYWVRTAS